eukprot:6214532-Pyramimonas_sp.AAC.1
MCIRDSLYSFADVYTQVHEAVQAADSKFRAKARSEWKAWLNVGVQAGAKRVHALLRDPAPWAASSTLSAD